MKHIFFFSLGLALFSACSEDDMSSDCGPEVILSSNYPSIQTDPYTVVSAAIEDTCLEVTISASGCDGQQWEAALYGAEGVIQVFPPTFPIKLSFSDTEDCEAIVQKTFSFDLSSLTDSYYQFYVALEGYEPILEYNALNPDQLVGSWSLSNINGGLLGVDQDYVRNEIVWSFDADTLTIMDNTSDKNIGLQAGHYAYELTQSEANGAYFLSVDGGRLGFISILHASSFSVDDRAVDGLQYIFER